MSLVTHRGRRATLPAARVIALVGSALLVAGAARGDTVVCGAGGCPEVVVGSASGLVGEAVSVAVTLNTKGNEVSGAAVFILYSAVDFGDPLPSCTAGPTIEGIGKSFTTDNSTISGQLSFNVFGAPTTPIPDATVLANCSFTIAAGAAGGTLVNDEPQTADTTPADYVSTSATNGMIMVLGDPTSTATRTSTPPSTATQTPSATPTDTPTTTPTATRTPTPAPTATPSGSPTPTMTPTDTPSPTGTATRSATVSPSVNAAPTSTASATATPTSTPTGTGTPTQTASATTSPTSTPTGIATDTQTPALTPGYTATANGTSTPTGTETQTAAASETVSALPTRSSTAAETRSPTPVCVGDCDRDGTVRIDELVKGLNIVIGVLPLASCPGFLGDGLAIDDLLVAVGNSLNGCQS